MRYRTTLVVVCVAVLAGAAWIGVAAKDAPPWREIAPGVYRSPGPVAGYALVDGGLALLIDAPLPHADVKLPGNPKIDAVVLTHPHRPVCAGVASFLDAKIPVRAPKAAAPWLTPEGIAKFWKDSLPLRSSTTAYFVVPSGFAELDLSLQPGQKTTWKSWSLEWINAPGHARAQLAVLAQKHGGKKILFAGGVIAAAGKLFAPYTTDWDHWTDLGLVPTAKSLEALADAGPDVIAPSYGPIIAANAPAALRQTAAAVREAGFLKSFERYTKKRLGNEPQYPFLAKEQAESNGSKPWSQVSTSLYLTGNTYVLVSKDGPCLMVDPWGMRTAGQWKTLQEDKKLGPLEVVWFSHAHYDHYDGVYDLPRPDTFEAWTLDVVAPPLEQPLRWRAPFLDPRPVIIHKKPKAGDTLAWREYRFRFHHLPGQSLYTMGVETEIDGKKCFFTADNFYHQDMFAGTGGWMGLNRAFPPYYATSAKIVLDAVPDWVLAEHGGPFEFSAEDWRRRIAWAEAAGKALDALSPSGRHLWDYNPHGVRVEPLVSKAKAGGEVAVELILENDRTRPGKIEVAWEGKTVALSAAAGQTRRTPITLRAPMKSGRHIVALQATEAGELCPADAFGVIDVE
jgi:glyoxylase-like metal-dependent hydrolase (beta-lactamase superfamily II)